jgi:hypothetical protein
MAERKNPKSVNGTSLSSLIDAVREDIDAGAKARKGKPPMFKLSQVTVETEVVFDRTLLANGKINLKLVELGAEGSERSGAASRISLTFVPFDPARKEDQSLPASLVAGGIGKSTSRNKGGKKRRR